MNQVAGMAVDLVSADESPKEAKRGREISTIDFPYNSLDDVVVVAKAVHKLGGTECMLDALAAELGHDTINSGGFRQKVSSAHDFGLTSLSQGVVSLSSIGARIVDPDQERAARAEAFLKVPLYNAIYEEFKGKVLPPNSGLEAKMVSLGVSNKQKDKARQVFQRSAKEAGFFAYGNTRLVSPVNGNLNTPPKSREFPPEGKPFKKTGGSGGGGDNLHPFIQGLLDKLPEPDAEWSIEGRKKWLQTAANIFDLMYLPILDETGELAITIDKDSAK